MDRQMAERVSAGHRALSATPPLEAQFPNLPDLHPYERAGPRYQTRPCEAGGASRQNEGAPVQTPQETPAIRHQQDRCAQEKSSYGKKGEEDQHKCNPGLPVARLAAYRLLDIRAYRRVNQQPGTRSAVPLGAFRPGESP
jgi:hypothetical protein